MKWLKLTLSIAVNISVTPTNYKSMSPFVSTEDGKTAQVDIPVVGRSVKVVRMSKEIDLIRNADR